MRKQGSNYEEKARFYLEKLGYRILAKNQLYRVGEIDIIAEDESCSPPELVFIEVRKRSAESYLEPEETLTPQKQRRLRKAIQLFLLSYRGRAQSVRIDLVGFKGEELIHRPNFF